VIRDVAELRMGWALVLAAQGPRYISAGRRKAPSVALNIRARYPVIWAASNGA
jgi:hypothetical protein